MGTINFSTGDFLTLCNEPFDPFRYTEEEYNDNYEYLTEVVKNILDRYDFDESAFSIHFEYGYYEGFAVVINEHNYVYYDDSIEKAEAYKSVKALQECLIELTNEVGLIKCVPGWCMRYCNDRETRKAVRHACAEIRRYIKATPTFRSYTNARKNNYVQEV